MMRVMKTNIVIARGDGIGPEIMDVVLQVMKAANADIHIDEIEVGEKVYLKGLANGIEPKSWDLIKNAKAFLKAPITTPEGGGFRSLNVTIRAALGLYANVRPCVAYHPFVDTLHPGMDLVVIRENEEDLYTGIEYRPSDETVHALKVITKKGCEKIIRYAFDYAARNGRKKVTCFTKDNILKMSDGLFRHTFDVIAKEYPDIVHEHWIVDIGAAKLADNPTQFDVVVLPNLYGDILSDVAAQIAGSVGLAGSANIGEKGAMFEAIHGSAPRRAGQNLANPSGLLLAACMMLEHIGQPKVSELIHNAWLKTLEEGIHTYDIFEEGKSTKKVGTKEFGEAIVAHIGQLPQKLQPVRLHMQEKKGTQSVKTAVFPRETKRCVGADFYIDAKENPLSKIQKATAAISGVQLTLITNRGAKVFPDGSDQVNYSDLWRCRFMADTITQDKIIDLMKVLVQAGLDVTSQENLYMFDEIPGFSSAVG